MILYIESPKGSTKKLLELINEFNEVARYKINIQKSVVFLYANNELTGKLRKQSHSVASKRIKSLGINLIKNVKDLYSENYKTLKKEVEEDTNKWEHMPYSWIGRNNIIKMSIYPEQSTDSTQYLSRFQ